MIILIPSDSNAIESIVFPLGKTSKVDATIFFQRFILEITFHQKKIQLDEFYQKTHETRSQNNKKSIGVFVVLCATVLLCVSKFVLCENEKRATQSRSYQKIHS
jgi:hypothetical protein